jgi:hypothetical protein
MKRKTGKVATTFLVLVLTFVWALPLHLAMTEKVCTVALDELMAMRETMNSASQELLLTEWNATYGGASADEAHALVQTSDGGYALAGGTRSFGAGGSDVWLIRTDSSGNAVWNKTFGGAGDDWAEALVKSNDGGYAMTGPTSSYGAGSDDFWLLKTDADGDQLWSRTYGGTGDDIAEALVQTSDGGYAIIGPTQSSGVGDYDIWLVKTDASGNMQWSKSFGGLGMEWAEGLVQTSDGGYAIAGTTQSIFTGDLDVWLIKTDASGNMQWSQTYGELGTDWAEGLVQSGDGGYALAGTTQSIFTGDLDVWLIKTDASGKVQWNATYGGASADEAHALVQTSDGGYALAGGTRSFGAGNWDVWFVKTDALGNTVWNKTYGGASVDWAEALVQSNDGRYAMVGRTASSGADDYDFWLVETRAVATISCDINHDGTIDILDAIMLAKAYFSTPSSPRWNADADINDDNIVNIYDAILLATDFGKTGQSE